MGLFSETTIQQIRDANDIVQVVESYGVSLKNAGSNFQALCPFHNEKTPSFNVNPALQIFKCFGCGVGGDVFRFIQLMERIEFPEAIEVLAARAGIEAKREGGDYHQRAEESSTDSKKALQWANSIALKYYEKMLRHPDEGRRAREYFASRGFTENIVGSWRLGWSPDSWDGLLETLVQAAGEHKRDKAVEAGVNAGVLRENEAGKIYDAFRGRVMFPIFDSQNRPIGFGGRVFEEKPESGGKYINTSEGKLFQKRKLLYGLNFAVKEMRLTKQAVIVEGYTDTIMCHQYGVKTAVATLGTSLTREHIQLLRRNLIPDGKVIALFDADSAGEKATERAVELFMEEDVPLRIVRSLEVKDACEFLPKFGAEKFLLQIQQAEDAFAFSLRRAFQGAADDTSGRAGAVQKIMNLVNRCPNRVKLEMMRREVSAAAGVPLEALPKAVPQRTPGSVPERRGLGSTKPQPAARSLEEALSPAGNWRKEFERRLLRYMFERKDWCEEAVDRFPPDKMLGHACAEIAAKIRDSWLDGNQPDARELLASVREEYASEIITDFVNDQGPPLTKSELKGILTRLENEEMQEELQDMKREPWNGRELSDEELMQRLQLNRKIRGIGSGGES